MRTFIAAFATIGLLVSAAQAADDTSPIVGKFPDVGTRHTTLFTLKKNGISLRMSAEQFCHDLGYGHAITRSDDPTKGFWELGSKELPDGATDVAQATRELNWVMCVYGDANRDSNR